MESAIHVDIIILSLEIADIINASWNGSESISVCIYYYNFGLILSHLPYVNF
jgi:hypothetical protein